MTVGAAPIGSGPEVGRASHARHEACASVRCAVRDLEGRQLGEQLVGARGTIVGLLREAAQHESLGGTGSVCRCFAQASAIVLPLNTVVPAIR